MKQRSEAIDEMLGEADRAEQLDAKDPDGTVFVRARRPKDPSQVYSVRIPVSAVEDLRRMADRAHVPVTTLMRQLILAQVDVEQKMITDRPETLGRLVRELEQTLATVRSRLEEAEDQAG